MATAVKELNPPSVKVAEGPIKKLDSQTLRQLGTDLNRLFLQYVADRLLTEQKWMRNLRQYLGIYDPEIETQLAPNQSRAYPRLTRVKCISMLARIMNLMFPGNEDNWEIQASPSATMDPKDVQQAVLALQNKYQQAQTPLPNMSDLIEEALRQLAQDRADTLTELIKDQLNEIGGDQTLDYISLNRKVVESGIRYGVGVLEGPFVREETRTFWAKGPAGFVPRETTIRKPQFEVISVWDYYPDLSAKTLTSGDGYFLRRIMGRSDIRKLANRADFFGDQVKDYLKQNPRGNYMPKPFETEIKTMGTRVNVQDQTKMPHGKYEVIIWKGPVSAEKLTQLGADVPDNLMADDIDAEVWMIDSHVIKADVNTWRKLGVDVRTIHTFVFDEDDTSPIGNGLPNVMRDSQMSVSNAVRMALDNASVVCGPNVEINTNLLERGQDITSIYAYKIWRRDDDGVTQQFPAVREIQFDSHLEELSKLVEMFMQFADLETFVGPATGGDMQQMPSEPARTAAGQSMMMGNAALPFKDVIRNFDFFTQSVILSLVYFNSKFNPQIVKVADFDVIARGATSLVAKEVRGVQTDILAQTLSPEDRDWIDEEKFLRQRLSTRDMGSIMVPQEEAMRNRAQRTSTQAQMSDLQMRTGEANIKKLGTESLKNVTQAQKNSAAADAHTAGAAADIVETGLSSDQAGTQGQSGPAGQGS